MKAARKVVESLANTPSERTAKILVEFRKLNHTVDETELWCTLMRELVAVGRDAVPQLCAELDRTDRRSDAATIGFRAASHWRPAGGPRADPSDTEDACSGSSDYGLIVPDGALTEFMQKHDLREGQQGGQYFDFGRPVREIFGALHKLTGQNFDDSELFGLHRSDDPRRQWLSAPTLDAAGTAAGKRGGKRTGVNSRMTRHINGSICKSTTNRLALRATSLGQKPGLKER